MGFGICVISFAYNVISQLFCEVCEGKVKLENTGSSTLEFFSTCSHSEDYQSCDLSLQAGWLCVNPKMGCLEPGSSVEFSVAYFPGVTGEFNVVFLMEV